MQYQRVFIPINITVVVIFLVGCSSGGEEVSLDPEAARLLDDALVSQEAGYPQLALAFVDSAIAIQSDHATPYFIRGRLLRSVNSVQEAEVAFRQALEADPEYQDAWLNLGDIAFSQRAYSEALDAYAAERDVLDANRERFGLSFDVRYGEASSRVELQKGRAYRQLGESEQALASFEEAASLDSTNASAYADLSRALLDAGRLEEALSAAQRALDLAPRNPDYMFILGEIIMDSGNPQRAIPLFQAALQHKPWFSEALYKMGQALVQIGEEESGEAYLEMADALQAKNEAIEKARFNAEQFKNDPERWLTLATLLLEIGRVDEAVRPLNIASALEPDNLSIQNDLANLALVQGDTLQAISRLKSLLAQDSTFAEGWFNLGVVHAMKGEYDEARRYWRETLRLDSSHQEAKLYLTQVPE